MKSCGCMSALPCGCCSGTEPITPETEFNRPGLAKLRYRAGTHATFFETMLADLSRDRRLDGLSTRESADPSIALLDAWATVGDVLTFYTERIANEGFLATLEERRSALELANLVGYRPRPGVSASVFLAYTLDDAAKATIPAGSLARSVPADGEAQQAFETSEPLEANSRFNNLQVRLSRPPTIRSILEENAVYLKGASAPVRKGDPLFVEFGSDRVALCRAREVTPDSVAGRTKVSLEVLHKEGAFDALTVSSLAALLRPLLRVEDFRLTLANPTVKQVLPILQELLDELESGSAEKFGQTIDQIATLQKANPPRSTKAAAWLGEVVALKGEAPPPAAAAAITVDTITADGGLLNAPSLSPASSYHRTDHIKTLFARNVENPAQISGPVLATLSTFRSEYRDTLAAALANARVTADPVIRVYSVVSTAPFGYNAPPRATTVKPSDDEVHIAAAAKPLFTTAWSEWPLEKEDIDLKSLDLEKELENVGGKPRVAVRLPKDKYIFLHQVEISTESRAAYGLAGKVTRLKFKDDVPRDKTLASLRPVKVFVASDELPLAEEPVTDPVCGSDEAIELDGLYDGLTPGKWIILTGEREDTPGTSGVPATELLLIADVEHRTRPNLLGDTVHTFIRVTVPSSYCYKRDAVKIYGNVVKATNGETRKEVIGSGDSAQPFQKFSLKQPPLTYLAAPTASGSESTLRVYVNDLEWHEESSLIGLTPFDRRFSTMTDESAATTVVFGNGVTGARVPTGNANVRSAYRNGIGKGGNVQAGQITVLGSKPLGVKEVTNPLRASGGADRDSRDQIRSNAPLSVTALDRLVSVDDYADFARTFAGIGKASSTILTDGHRQLVEVTVAGVDDIPIAPSSDLYLNLRRALHLYGDRNQPLQLDVRVAKFLVFEAGVKVDADYPWETIAPAMRAALLDAFRFDRRELGQNSYLSEVLDVLQRVPGVVYIDANLFGAISEDELTPSAIAGAITKLERDDAVTAHLSEPGPDGITPAEIAYFTPAVSATIALNQL
jgi:hypothetical protein